MSITPDAGDGYPILSEDENLFLLLRFLQANSEELDAQHEAKSWSHQISAQNDGLKYVRLGGLFPPVGKIMSPFVFLQKSKSKSEENIKYTL